MGKALEIAQACPQEEASTLYVMFVVKVSQAREDEALRLIEMMVSAPDFDRRMLFLATQLAHENKMRNLLLKVLGSLLQSLQTERAPQSNFEGRSIEGITLIRCIVRLVLEMLREPGANVPSLVETLITNLSAALQFVLEVKSKGCLSAIRKDVSWIWRSGYNTAVEGCTAWEGVELGIATLFELTEQLMVLAAEDLLEADAKEINVHRCFAAFSSISGKVFAARHLVKEKSSELQQSIMLQIPKLKGLIDHVHKQPGASESEPYLQDMVHTLLLFEIEILCQQRAWHAVQTALQFDDKSNKSQKSLMVFEAIADMLWTIEQCPSHVLEAGLEVRVY